MGCDFVSWAKEIGGDENHIILHEYEKGAKIPSEIIKILPQKYKELFPSYLSDKNYVHRPSGVVGIFPFICGCNKVHTIIVAPKIVEKGKKRKLEGLDKISDMAVYAISASREENPRWLYYEREEIYACWRGKVYGMEKIMLFLTLRYLQKIKSLIKKDFRRYYLSVEDTLRCEIKGKIRIPRYLSNWVSGKRIDIPCRWNIFTYDNWDNRILKSVLEVCLRWAHPQSVLYNYISELASGELFYAFSEVSDVLPWEVDFSRTKLKPVSKYYRDSLSIAEQIINGVNSITSVSSNFKPVWIKTHELFEGFVNAIAKMVETTEYKVGFQEGKGIFCNEKIEYGPKAKPDITIYKNGNPLLVVDAKYKVLLEKLSEEEIKKSPKEIEESIIKVLTQDMYQLFFYLSSTGCKRGIIIFPFWKTDGATVYPSKNEIKNKWREFNTNRGKNYVMFVGLNLAREIKEVFDESKSILLELLKELSPELTSKAN